MEEILKKLLNRIKQEESDIQALQKKLFKEKLKTALLNCELDNEELTKIELNKILEATIKYNNTIEDILLEKF